MIRGWLFFVTLWSCHTLIAQQDTTLSSTMLDDVVVVTGQYEPQSIRKSVYQVRTIPEQRIQAKASVNLQDLLNTELNFRFSQDLAVGSSNISMMGLPGQYVKVLVDGVPIVGRQGTGNDINLNQINVNTIDRIEIVQGPMAVSYGADAMAGVINIITKKAHQERLGISVRLHEESAGSEYGKDQGIHNQYIAANWSWDKLYVKGEISRNNFMGWKGSATGRDREWHPKKQWITSGVAGMKSDNLNVYYRLDYLNENIHNPGVFNNGEANDREYITNRYMHQVQGDAKLSKKISYNGAIAFTDFSRRTRTVTVHEATGDVRLSLAGQDKTAFTGLTARGTFQYKLSDKISLQPGYDVNRESGEGGRLIQGNHIIYDYAIFVSAEYSPNSFVSIRPGVRMIRNSQYDAPPAVASLNTKFVLSGKSDLRVSYGRGFRAPSLRELYFYFYDANHAIEGNPDLEAELSHSFNAALQWRPVVRTDLSADIQVSGFYNALDNMINTGYKAGSNTIVTYINIDKYRTQGVILNGTLTRRRFEMGVGFSYTGYYNEFEDGGDDLPSFTWSPEVNSTVTYNMDKAGLTFNAFYKYTGKLPGYNVMMEDGEEVIRLSEIEGYHWADVSAQKKLFKNIRLSVGMKNLFNVKRISSSVQNTGDAHSSGPVRPIGYGTSYYVNLLYTFSKPR